MTSDLAARVERASGAEPSEVTISLPLCMVEQIAPLLTELAEDLEAELNERYQDWQVYPVQRRRRDRDMAPVNRAKALAAALRARASMESTDG